MDKFVVKRPRLMVDSEAISEEILKETSQERSEETSKIVQDERIVQKNDTTKNFSEEFGIMDIGNYIECQIPLSDKLKYELLTTTKLPPCDYNFKYDVDQNKRPFLYQWLNQYSPWLTYSKKLKGAFCKICVLFRPPLKRGLFGAFIVKPCQKFKDFHTEARSHANSQWHKDATVMAKNFESIISRKQLGVAEQINSAHHNLVESNRQKLVPIISTLIFCGTHDVALRGKTAETGNFADLIKLRIEAGDTLLADHIENCGKNAKYTSHMTQNELLTICGETICKKIVEEVNSSECFSLLADESADFAGVEQLSMGVRFVDKEMNVREEFLGFSPLEKFKATDIANKILQVTTEKYHLDMSKLVGLGFDGCSTMAGKEKGVQKIIRNKYPKANFFHCASHRLNLVINDLNAVPEFRNAVGIVKEVIRFFRESPLRRKYVKNLPMLCETRWSAKYKSIRIFCENFNDIVESLDNLAYDLDVNQATRTAACKLLASTGNAQFLICLVIMSKYCSHFEPIANILQTKSIDLEEVHNHVEKLLNICKSNREEKNVGAVFREIFKHVEEIAENFDIKLSIPRIVSKQKHRSNYTSANSPEDYFRVSIFIPYLDSLINCIEARFSNENRTPTYLCCLHPHNIKSLNLKEFNSKIKAIEGIYHIENLNNEAESWFHYWKELNTNSLTHDTCYSEILAKHCTFFPAVSKSIKILLSLPPTTCTIERSFSTLRRVKTWLRSTMSQNRLNGLCLLSVHREKVQNIKEQFIQDVINEFGKEKRKIQFLFSNEE